MLSGLSDLWKLDFRSFGTTYFATYCVLREAVERSRAQRAFPTYRARSEFQLSGIH